MDLADLPSGPLLVAVGGFGVKDQDRIGLITLEESPPRVLADEYLPTSEIDALVAKIPNARKGGRHLLVLLHGARAGERARRADRRLHL